MSTDASNTDIEIKKIRNRIEYLYDVHKLEMVVEEAKKLLSIDIENEYGLYMLAKAYNGLNKIDEAEAVVLEYLKNYQENVCGHVLYGNILQGKDDYKRATEEFQKAIDLDPDDETNYIKLAINLMIEDDKNLPKCIVLAEKAVAINPNNGINHTYLGELYFLDKRLYDAEREAIKGLELDSQQHMCHDEYARIQYACGNIDVAKEHFEELFRLNPNYNINRNWAEDIRYFKENMQEYLEDRIKYLKDVARAYPSDKKVHLLLAKAYIKTKENKNALKEWEKHLLLNPENIDIELEFAKLLVEQISSKKLVLYLDKLQRKNPGNENIQTHINHIYRNLQLDKKLKKNQLNKLMRICFVIITIILLTNLVNYLCN